MVPIVELPCHAKFIRVTQEGISIRQSIVSKANPVTRRESVINPTSRTVILSLALAFSVIEGRVVVVLDVTSYKGVIGVRIITGISHLL